MRKLVKRWNVKKKTLQIFSFTSKLWKFEKPAAKFKSVTVCCCLGGRSLRRDLHRTPNAKQQTHKNNIFAVALNFIIISYIYFVDTVSVSDTYSHLSVSDSGPSWIARPLLEAVAIWHSSLIWTTVCNVPLPRSAVGIWAHNTKSFRIWCNPL